MVKFIIIRHGYSEFNKAGRFTGQLDIPLDELGVRQAELTAEYVISHFHVDEIYSSSLSRAIETVRPIAETFNLPIHLEEGLKEIYAGCWQGMLIDDIKKQYPKEFEAWATDVGLARCGDGESTEELIGRSKKIFHRIAEENEGKTVLISTHGGVVSALQCEWLQVPLSEMRNLAHVTNASVTVAEYELQTKSAKFLQIGYDEHLKECATKPPLIL